MLTPNKLIFPFGVSYISANFGENRSRNATVRVRMTNTLTNANIFHNLSHVQLYAIAMGQIILIGSDANKTFSSRTRPRPKLFT